jgi:hypothetical protein
VIAARSQLEVRVELGTGRLLVGGDDVERAMTLVERGLGHDGSKMPRRAERDDL